jgi:hypothetical protein
VYSSDLVHLALAFAAGLTVAVASLALALALALADAPPVDIPGRVSVELAHQLALRFPLENCDCPF